MCELDGPIEMATRYQLPVRHPLAKHFDRFVVFLIGFLWTCTIALTGFAILWLITSWNATLTYALNIRPVSIAGTLLLAAGYAINYKISLDGSDRRTFQTWVAIAGSVISVSAFSYLLAWIAGRT